MKRILVRSRNRFIERSLTGTLSFVRASLESQEYAQVPGFLQRRDYRAKLLVVFGMLAAAACVRSVSFLAGMYVSVLLLAYLSRIPCGFFLKRTWVFVPLFSLLLAIPAVFEAVTPGERIAVFSVGPWEAAVTRQGAMSALRLLSRVTVSVSLAVLLVLTTPHTLLLKGMRVCAVPALFVETAMLCHRYLFFFVELVQNVFLGIKSRCGAGLAARTGREVVGSGIAHLWQRSVQLQEQVYQAMRSRGYSGEPRTEGEPPPSRGDWAWAGAMLLLCAVVSVLGVTGRL